jgi:trehalose-phosphatase
MLDYDGTLAPFRADRHAATPYAGVREALSGIILVGHTRLVVISGRAMDELVALLDMDTSPEMWGSHGWERRTASGVYRLSPLPEAAREGLNMAIRLAEDGGLASRCEKKPASAALHWRGLSEGEAAAMREWGAEHWAPLAPASGMELRDFDGGLELRPTGADKGAAVRVVLAESPPGTVAAYLGDDLTDEDAFEALPPSGLGVLVRPEPRPTAAGAWIRPPEGLMDFLARWASASEGVGSAYAR